MLKFHAHIPDNRCMKGMIGRIFRLTWIRGISIFKGANSRTALDEEFVGYEAFSLRPQITPFEHKDNSELKYPPRTP
jgi:hypothetical protein